MHEFPAHLLSPLSAKLGTDHFGKAALEVFFAPSDLPLPDPQRETPLRFDTSLRADGITLPSTDLMVLAGQAFDFPVNPQPGYIDASVYFVHVHNPVDITRLRFGPLDDGHLTLTVTSRWVLTFEQSGFDDFDLTFDVPLTV